MSKEKIKINDQLYEICLLYTSSNEYGDREHEKPVAPGKPGASYAGRPRPGVFYPGNHRAAV